MKSVVLALAILCLATPSHAIDCDQVRAIVKKLGKERALQLAIAKGATKEEIEEGRKCFSERR